MSTAGLGALFNAVFYFAFTTLAVGLLVRSRKRSGWQRSIRAVTSIAIGVFLIVCEAERQHRLDENAIGYLGTHKLTSYNGEAGYSITIEKNHRYVITNQGIEQENGIWHYFDDGDIAYMEYYPSGSLFSHYFNDGNQYGDIEN